MCTKVHIKKVCNVETLSHFLRGMYMFVETSTNGIYFQLNTILNHKHKVIKLKARFCRYNQLYDKEFVFHFFNENNPQLSMSKRGPMSPQSSFHTNEVIVLKLLKFELSKKLKISLTQPRTKADQEMLWSKSSLVIIFGFY